MQQRDLSARQFGDTAANYLSSTVHAGGADLDRIEALTRSLQPAAALDLGCGAGHVAFALARGGAGQISACDVAAPMLAVVAGEAASRGHGNIQTRQGPAEQLPFADHSFALVVSRYSAHHWAQVPQALAEVARVLAPGGTFVMVDIIAPESPLLDTTLQTLEVLRDLSHVRNYRRSEWAAMLSAAGFAAPATDSWKVPLQFDSWVARIRTPAPRIAALRTMLADLPTEARDYFSVAADGSFVSDAAWFGTVRP